MTNIEILKRLYKDYTKKYLSKILLAVFFSILVAASTSATAWLLDPAIDKIFLNRDQSLLLLIPFFIIIAFATKGISLYMAKVLMINVAEEVKKKIQLDMRKNGGLISSADLRNYKAKFRTPIRFNYKDLSIVTMPLPSSGGLILALMLNMIEQLELDQTNPHSAENIQKISEIMQIAYSLRSVYMADSDFYDVPEEEFLSKDKAKDLLENINLKRMSFRETLPRHRIKREIAIYLCIHSTRK